ncbi:MAG TPA: hypothetical protein VGR84_19255 [Candidatus Acidoferrales bacterium]|nr:hypothetical protein [Candidatus Acidoferrales bacterium]
MGLNFLNNTLAGAAPTDHQTAQIYTNTSGLAQLVTGIDVHGGLNFESGTGAFVRWATNYLEGAWLGAPPNPALVAGLETPGWLWWQGVSADAATTIAYEPSTATALFGAQIFINHAWRGQALIEPGDSVWWSWATLAETGETTHASFEGGFTVWWDYALLSNTF